MGKYSREFGQIAENIAADYILAKGMIIRERNWSPVGGHKEIDIISQIDNHIIFIEVKARKGDFSDPLEAMTPRKIRNLFRCADSYLNSIDGDHWLYRFDIITITGDADNYTLNHIEDAFLGPLTTY